MGQRWAVRRRRRCIEPFLESRATVARCPRPSSTGGATYARVRDVILDSAPRARNGERQGPAAASGHQHRRAPPRPWRTVNRLAVHPDERLLPNDRQQEPLPRLCQQDGALRNIPTSIGMNATQPQGAGSASLVVRHMTATRIFRGRAERPPMGRGPRAIHRRDQRRA